jgi:hypothetical protein
MSGFADVIERFLLLLVFNGARYSNMKPGP